MKNANYFYEASNGSENLYRYSFTKFIYPDGVKALVQECKAYWLIDLIISHQCNRDVNFERFQVWNLSWVKNSFFKIIATDGNNFWVAFQQIPFSDFPYDLAIIWLVDGCLMLPSEY